MDSSNIYAACAEVLALCQSMKNDLAAIVDPVTGYAPRMKQICQDLMQGFEATPKSGDYGLIKLEQDTWALIQALMPARLTDPPNKESASELLLENPYTPASTLAQAILHASPLLSELVVVREWLHEISPFPRPLEANNGYWKFTKHTILQSLRSGNPQRDSLVSDMDPDAINRGDGAVLASDDANYERNLLQALYAYVRAGQLHYAVEVCRIADQPWRAASLRGSLLFQWKAISTERRDSENGDEGYETMSGNPNRQLWKNACIRAALSTALSDQERLLYASIVPTPQTHNLLKSACRTWEDHLWVEVSIICEEKESRELNKLSPGSFWDSGLDNFGKNSDTSSSLPPGQQSMHLMYVQKHEDDWGKEVKRTLENLKSVAVTEGPAADHVLHVSQRLIILDQIDNLLDVFAQSIQRHVYNPTTFEYHTLCRFFAHLCLYLQMIDVSIPPQSTQIILESYLAVLEDSGQRELIALYAGALGVNAVERYAEFLVSLELTADVNERRLALTRASEHGLDVERVARVAAERTLEKAFNVLPKLSALLPSIIDQQPAPNKDEILLLRSIEWTTFFDSTYPNALEQATVILRYFLCAGRIQAAQSLLNLLPVELSTINGPEEIATEYMHYQQLFFIWDKLDRVSDFQLQETTFMQHGISRDSKNSWINGYRNIIDEAHEKIIQLLTTEWLTTELDDGYLGPVHRRKLDLERIRQIFVPELVLRLHVTLYQSRKILPENLRRCVELANIVADERYRLYNDFLKDHERKIVVYLDHVREAILAGLESGGSDPFKVVYS